MPPFRRTAYLLAALSALALGGSFLWHPAPPPAFTGIRGSEVPTRLGTFQSAGDSAVDPEVQAALASADIVSRTYTGDAGKPIDFMLIGGTDRSALHDPRSCLVGGGWRLEEDRTEPLAGTTAEARACHALGQPGGTNFDIVYLYVVDGKVRNRVTDIRAEMLVSALLGRKNRPVYFLRVMQPLDDDPALRAQDHQRLLSFAAEAWKSLATRLGAAGGA